MVEQSKNTIESVTGSLEELAKAIMQKELVEKQDVVSLVQYCKKSIDNFNHTNNSLCDLMKTYETFTSPNPFCSSLVEEYRRLEPELFEEKKTLEEFFVKRGQLILSSTTDNELLMFVVQFQIRILSLLEKCNGLVDILIDETRKLTESINCLNKE